MREIKFTVLGTPQPQGSMRQFPIPGRQMVITSDNKELKSWRKDVRVYAWEAMQKAGLVTAPRNIAITLEANFYFLKPKSTPAHVTSKTTKPDFDKLTRALADALTSVVYEDDSQVTRATVGKFFGSPERAEVRVEVHSL